MRNTVQVGTGYAQVALHAGSAAQPWWIRHWFLLMCAIAAASPALASLARNYWSTEQGAAGPIILISGLWLLWHEAQGAVRGKRSVPIIPVVAAVLAFGAFAIVASVTAKQWLQLLGIYACLLAVLYGMIGGRQMRRLWAPIVYLAFVIPPPDNIVVPLTHTLKGSVANAAVAVLAGLGYPVAREGVNLYIGPYELVVAAACSGMNSLISLTAIGIFYVYLLHRAHWRYALLLALLMVPIALFANMVRVIMLLLITYHLGDAAGQGLLHEVAGLFIFLVALTTLVALDAVLSRVLLHRVRAA
jgi:exosortase